MINNSLDKNIKAVFFSPKKRKMLQVSVIFSFLLAKKLKGKRKLYNGYIVQNTMVTFVEIAILTIQWVQCIIVSVREREIPKIPKK